MNYYPDTYWSGGIELVLPEFLELVFPGASDIFDMSRGFEIMDKELQTIFPEAGQKRDRRIVDKLIKAYRKDGCEELILIHLEVQGYHDPQFARRMFIYFYRLYEKYNVPITSIALFTTKARPTDAGIFRYETLGTKITFEYNTLHIFDYPEAQLLAMDNAMGIMLLAAQKALYRDKFKDSDLAQQRLLLAKALIASGKYGHEEMLLILAFIKNVVYINNPEINRNFDNEILTLTQNKVNMSILELIKEEGVEIGREEGKQEGVKIGMEKGVEIGKQEGREEGREEMKHAFVHNLIVDLQLSDVQISRIAEVSVEFVQKIRKEIEEGKGV